MSALPLVMHSEKAKDKRVKHRAVLQQHGFVRVGTARKWLKTRGHRKVNKAAPFALNAVVLEIARQIVEAETSVAKYHNTKTIDSLEASRAFESLPFLKGVAVAKDQIDVRAPLFRYEKAE